eukprot:CAMPEP_0118947288 /NCGR_PEP_ID=MMETSP1169-20130426/45738_1 /TAXON_ID=36882 /ORGANISM="Pyramimonas obovata, Strain CCMP722" /LENGTH=338 /DNA_ID=CAMNT_0006893471 /DNA_START=157 /DNA_END=1173 /DNA_ORIENTATION=+
MYATQLPHHLVTTAPYGARAWCNASVRKEALVEVRQTESAGRGMFAAKALLAGEEIFRVHPIVVHPTIESQQTVCFHCLRPLPQQQHQPSTSKGQDCQNHHKFCGEKCREAAWDSYLQLQSSVDLSDLEEHCRVTGVKFPLVIGRLAFLCLAGQREPDALSMLCYANIAQPPREWMHEYGLLRNALERGMGSGFEAHQLAFLTEEWYVNQLARLHLNAFKVELVRPLELGSEQMLLAMADCVTGGGNTAYGACGTGVYLLPSFFNHSCDPNVDVEFPENNSTMTLRTRRDVTVGEELYITYIDASAAAGMRQKELQWGYGFVCQCSRCVEATSSTTQP